jgi:hypothetical protein
VASWIALRQDTAPPPAKDPVETLRGLETSWAGAVATGDPARIGRFLAADFLFTGPASILQDRAGHLEDFRTGKLKIASMQIKDSTVHPYESGAAVSVLADVKGTYDGRDIGGTYRFLDAWLLSQRAWLAVARQQTRVATA